MRPIACFFQDPVLVSAHEMLSSGLHRLCFSLHSSEHLRLFFLEFRTPFLFLCDSLPLAQTLLTKRREGHAEIFPYTITREKKSFLCFDERGEVFFESENYEVILLALCQRESRYYPLQLFQQMDRELDPYLWFFQQAHHEILPFIENLKEDSPLLIQGETGSGKTCLARCIAAYLKKKFIHISCPNLSQSLFESTLFGVKKGAYTGALNHKGLVEEANGGVLFLDEIGDIPSEIQPKFLKVVERGEFQRVGESIERKSKFLLICATNQELGDEVFRPELKYRISANFLPLPPLRRLKKEIPKLLNLVLELESRRMRKEVPCYSQHFLREVQEYPWPGNLREFSFVIRHNLENQSEYLEPFLLPEEKRLGERIS